MQLDLICKHLKYGSGGSLHTFLNLIRTSIFSSHPIFNKSTCFCLAGTLTSTYSVSGIIFSLGSSHKLPSSILFAYYDMIPLLLRFSSEILKSCLPTLAGYCSLSTTGAKSLCPSLQDADMSHCELSPPLQFLLPRDIQ